MSSIRVLLVDDHDLVRAGLRTLLQNVSGIEVVGEAGNGKDAQRLAQQLRPNVVLMDLTMPGLGGLDATARIVRQLPDVRVVVLSMNAAEEFILPAIRAGACGYLLKNVKAPELEQAIRAVARGETYLTPAVASYLVDDWRRRASVETSPIERLTPRQREVLQLLAEGHNTKEIARRLGISVKTVETYRAQLTDTLRISDIASLTRFAIRMGLVSADS